MPPHRVYIEAFLGSGAIMRRKRTAEINIGIEIDAQTIAAVKSILPAPVTVIHGDFFTTINLLILDKTIAADKDVLIYADPPYLMETRSCQRDLYRHEFSSASDHKRLLNLAIETPFVHWMISGYRSALYDEILHDWRRVDFQAMTRRGLVTESLWCNFPYPVELHDYSFLGRDNTERQRIKRKVATWTNRLLKMPILERQAILSAIRSVADETGCTRRQTQTNSTSRDLVEENDFTDVIADNFNFTDQQTQ